MGSRETAEQVYGAPPHVVFDALVRGARQVQLAVTNADPQHGMVWIDKPMSLMTWGELVTVSLRPAGPQQTAVSVESRLKFGFVAWGAHKKNFEHVHRAIDAGLAGAGGPHAQPFPQSVPQPFPQQHGGPPSQPFAQQQPQPWGGHQQPGHQQPYGRSPQPAQPHGQQPQAQQWGGAPPQQQTW